MKSDEWGEQGLKQSECKARYMRKNKTKNVLIQSPVWSPVSVVGKSPCGQVDCLKDLDPNSKTESA
jgi:hypothetical protein